METSDRGFSRSSFWLHNLFFFCDLERKNNHECRSFSFLAGHLNGSIHLIYQSFHNCHPQTCSMVDTSCIRMFLDKWFINMLQKILTHSNSRIRNHPSVMHHSICCSKIIQMRNDFSTYPIILNTISVDIQENLSHMKRTSVYIRIQDLV